MKKCQKCGGQYDASWAVCIKCGAELVSDESTPPKPDFDRLVPGLSEELGVLSRRLDVIERRLGLATAPRQTLAPTPAAPGFKDSRVETKQPAKIESKAGSGSDIESTIGLVWLNRIGAVALFLGAAFFIKYAFDNQWIGETGRIVLGFLSGAALFAGAEFACRKKFDVMAQSLHGAGAAVSYLTIFAAYGLYHLIGAVPAFFFMALISGFSALWAVRTNWMSAAVIGTSGAFLTLAVVGTGSLPPAAVYGYVALIDLGVLAVSLKKNWRVLNVLSFALSHWVLISMLGDGTHAVVNGVFAMGLFVIYCLLSIAHNMVRRKASDFSDILLVLANGLFACAELSIILKPFAGAFPGLLPLGFSAVYLGYSYSALKRRADDRALVLAYVGMALTFVTLTIPIQLNGQWITAAWAVESLLLFWLSFRTNLPKLRPWALGIGALSIWSLLLKSVTYTHLLAEQPFLWNVDTLTFFLTVGAMFAAAALYAHNKPAVVPSERFVVTMLVIGACVLMLYRLSIEVDILFAHIAAARTVFAASEGNKYGVEFSRAYGALFGARHMTLSALWIIYALASVSIGIYRRYRPLRLLGLVIFGLAVVKIFVNDLSQLDRVYRIVSFMILGGVLLVTSYFYQRYKDRIHSFALKD